MADIIDKEELDKDTVEPEVLDQQFDKKYNLLTEKAVSLKKSYINNISGTKSLKLAVSLSDNSIEVYDVSNVALHSVCRLSGHKNTLTEVVFSPKEDYLLYSSGQDGLVKLWDTRTGGSCAQEYKDLEDNQLRPYECMDVSCNARVLCAGSQLVQDDAYLVFWDQRVPKPLGGYWNTHTDDVTQVKFHKEKTEIIATGAMDGLLNVFNVMEQTEDDALMYSLNIENSVEKLTWLDTSKVSCITQSNDLQVWNVDTGDLVRSYSRDKVSRSIKRSKSDDCYLVDTYTSADDTHVLVAGSYGGHGDVLRSVTVTDKRLQPTTNFAGNKQTVRCLWYDRHSDLLVSGGESGFVTVWRRTPASGSGAATRSLSGSLNKLHVNRHKPY